MRYMLAALTICLLASGWLVASRYTVDAPMQTARVGAALPAQVYTAREQALIDRAKDTARSWGEKNPVVLDLTHLPLERAARAVGSDFEEFPSSWDPNQQVSLVRMRGVFIPPKLAEFAQPTSPDVGNMYVIYDATTGEVLSTGEAPDGPLLPPEP